MLQLGIDLGSTTAKVVVLDTSGNLLFGRYRRHYARIHEALRELVSELLSELGDKEIRVSLTGTAGMGVAERCGLPFVQEVVASSDYVRQCHPEVRTLIDIGGEDGKIIFFDPPGSGRQPTIRMNGNCAGGTGAFIDQMAGLLGTDVESLSPLAEESTTLYRVASRCGVFAKTDLQTLMSRNVPRSDIVASVYRAVAFQTVSTLSHGSELQSPVLFAGGPLGFQPGLRRAFVSVMGIDPDRLIVPEHASLLPAWGAALNETSMETRLTDIVALFSCGYSDLSVNTAGLQPLFSDKAEMEAWQDNSLKHTAVRVSHDDPLVAEGVFIGIDSGSRTSKIVVIDRLGRIVFDYYDMNGGDALETVITGLDKAGRSLAGNRKIPIRYSCVTGYAEDLLVHALCADKGVVETLAHHRAAREWDPDVSFILDIGGQDMKAMFVQNGIVGRMELNEACSSGTGSFIEGFAASLGLTVEHFARLACEARHPRDLGTRCTVFMNSKVKQALREGASPGDISAGLAYSVIRNCFQKVLKITDPSVVGNHVLAQGGTFRNPAVLRALEIHLGKPVIRPDIAGLMGAFGAALLARDAFFEGKGLMGQKESAVAGTIPENAIPVSTFIGLEDLGRARPEKRSTTVCGACENRCPVTRLHFSGGRIHHSGNRCERVFGNQGAISAGSKDGAAFHDIAFDMLEAKYASLFDRAAVATDSDAGPETDERARSFAHSTTRRLRIGLPRVLNMYEEFPFWHELLTKAGLEPVLSNPSSPGLVEPGYNAVMSENICYPAKIVHGHILDLVAQGVDRILYPMVRHERSEFANALNAYNCPIVTGYPEVVKSALDPQGRFGVPVDTPPISFRVPGRALQACAEYLKTLGIGRKQAKAAVVSAETAWRTWKRDLAQKGQDALRAARRRGGRGIMLLCRPYHADPLVNHTLTGMIRSYGMDVYTDDLIWTDTTEKLPDLGILSQWAFPNRLFAAADWAAKQDDIEVVHLNSFGCGPDALSVDEVRSLLEAHGKHPTLIRVDEVSSPGSLRLRVRSMVENLRHRGNGYHGREVAGLKPPVFTRKDRKRTILAPLFSPFYTDFIVESFRRQGYRMEVLGMPDRESVETGLRYGNHDICYPATIVIGDMIKALKSGAYDPDRVALAITQTGGQCRASSYAGLLKKALSDAGFGNTPVVTLSAAGSVTGGLNNQPGFKIGALRLGYRGFFGILYADAISKLFHATVVRERRAGLARELAAKWIAAGVSGPVSRILDYLPEAIADFNQALVHDRDLPRVGIVGEIFVKFNPFANNDIVSWLAEREVECDVPPLIDFFLQRFATEDFNAGAFLEKSRPLFSALLDIGEVAVSHYLHAVNTTLTGFKVRLSPFHTIAELARNAAKVLSLVNQYGESWLIAGDIAGFMETGTRHVLCLQPFGCIANHIVAKGVETKLKQQYPGLSLLFLDLDAGSSDVNLSNRVEFLIRGAKRSFTAKKMSLRVRHDAILY